MRKLLLTTSIAAAALAATPAFAATLYSNALLNGPTASPGSSGFNANAVAGAGLLSFNVDGFLSLDGEGNCCTDIFELTVNALPVLQLSYNLGGGGNNVVFLDLNGATITGGDPNPNNISFAGGQLQISLPVALLAGANSFGFSYSGGAQGIGDEAWGISSVLLTGPDAVPEPGSWALLLVGFGAVGSAMRRHKVRVSFA
jgi:hypothetical protein